MRPTANPQGNRAPEIEPPLRHTAPWRVSSVSVLPDFRFRVVFVDGRTGDVDMSRFLSDSDVDGTVFEPLRDPKVFSQARVVLGTIQWPNGAEVAPDAVYDAIGERSVWVFE